MDARPDMKDEGGITLVELMITLVVLTIGIFAVGSLFPAGSRGQQRDRMITNAGLYAQQTLEQLQAADWGDAELAPGRHPGGSATESLGQSGAWQRWYEVTTLAAPLDNLKKVTVSVTWTGSQPDTVTTATYVRR